MVKISGYRITDGKIIASSFDIETGIQEHEVTNMFDEDGEETADPHAAVSIVVKVSETDWRAVDIREFITLTGH